MHRFTLSLVSLAIWAAMFSLAYMGAVEGSLGASRLYCFFAWIGALLTALAAFGILADPTDEKLAEARAKGYSLPAWVRWPLSIALVMFLVWHGWWGSVIAALITSVSNMVFFCKPNERSVQSP